MMRSQGKWVTPSLVVPLQIDALPALAIRRPTVEGRPIPYREQPR